MTIKISSNNNKNNPNKNKTRSSNNWTNYSTKKPIEKK